MAVGITSTYSGKRKERFGHVSTAKCEEIKKNISIEHSCNGAILARLKTNSACNDNILITGANVMLRSNIPVYTGMEFDLQSVA